jgi:hypothetical protein
MRRTNSLGVRVQPDVKAGLVKAAADDGRTMSGLCERILSAWLTEHGYLPAPGAAKSRAAAKVKPPAKRRGSLA